MWNRQSRFTTLVNAFTPDLYRYAYWLCGESATAEDLVQETFLRAWRALDKLREERSAKAWLITTLRRENARRFARKRPEPGNVDVETIEAGPTYDTGTEAFVLRRALNELPSDYREPLVLQIVGGYDVAEIAAELGLSKGAATTRLFRARQKLRHALTADESDGEKRMNR